MQCGGRDREEVVEQRDRLATRVGLQGGPVMGLAPLIQRWRLLAIR